MSVLSDQFTNEQIPLGALGKFIPMWVSGHDPGRSDLLDELRVSFAPWTSKNLAGYIFKNYNRHLQSGIHGLTIQVLTIDKWLTAYQSYLPPHQLIIPLIDVPVEYGLSEGIIQHGFLYTGPKLKVVPNFPVKTINPKDFDYITFYQSGLMTNFGRELNDSEIEDYMGIDPESLYRAYMKGLSHGCIGRGSY